MSIFKRNSFDASQPALLAEQLSAGYPGNRYALSDISLNISGGERVAVIGPNGAGKSTLFKAIVGLLQFTHGHISIHGVDCYSSHIYVGYVPQQSEIDWKFPASVFDVVMMGRSRHIGWFRWPSKRDRAIVNGTLDHLSLGDLANRQISELSGGQRRRVFIARALAQDARVLLLDEPFAGVDQTAEKEIIDTLVTLTNQGITILLSTHHMHNDALQFDKVLILRRTILAYGAPNEVLTAQNLRAAYGTSTPVLHHGADQLTFGVDQHRDS